MASYHVRSNSLPSRPHPVIPEFDEQLCRLRAFEATSSSASTSISNKLNGLQDLLDCVDRLLLLPLNKPYLKRKTKNGLIRSWMDHSDSWMFATLPKMPCCKPRNPLSNFNLLFAEEEAVQLSSQARLRNS